MNEYIETLKEMAKEFNSPLQESEIEAIAVQMYNLKSFQDINICKDDSLESVEICFGDLFEYLDFLNDDIIDEQKMIQEGLFIETPLGLSPIVGIVKKEDDLLKITHTFGEVKVAKNHLFPNYLGQDVLASEAVELVTKKGISKILEKENLGKSRVYDILINHPNLYYTSDGVLHHNSVALVNTAASNVIKGKDVLFLTLEMTEEEIGKRIDSNILDINTNDFWKTNLKEFQQKFSTISGNLGKLVIKEYPAGTFNTLKLEAFLNEIKKESDFSPEIICIDYLTLMASSRTTLAKSGGTYSYYKLISEELHGFAKQHDVKIVTAAQLGRGAFGNMEADMSSISDSIGIIQTADTVIALLSSENLKANNQMVMKMLKNRNTGRLESVMVTTDFPKMKFFDFDGEADLAQPIQLGLGGLTEESNTNFEGFNFEG